VLLFPKRSIEVPEEIRKGLTPEEILDKFETKGRKINLGTHPGREFEENQEGKQRAIVRAFVVKDRVVVVGVIDMNPTEGAKPRDTARFLDSLRLEKKSVGPGRVIQTLTSERGCVRTVGPLSPA
jgi:hypothetical protein